MAEPARSDDGAAGFARPRPSFAVHPRRIVESPGHGLFVVASLRNVSARYPPWWNNWDIRWEIEMLRRLIRRDVSWRVEVHDAASRWDDRLPRGVPRRLWTLPDRPTADRWAEEVCAQLESGLRPFDLPVDVPAKPFR